MLNTTLVENNMFNTLTFSKKMQNVGMTQEVAEELASTLFNLHLHQFESLLTIKEFSRFEGEIKNMFNREVKNLTITQGGILIKLIDRETGNSSYDLLKDMKGGITAFFYQSIARIFGNNLKML